MKILGLEFSSDSRSVSVLDCGEKNPGTLLASLAEESGKTTRPFSLINQALATSGLTQSSVDCLAIGIGPGSYTGIRMAIAIAQGWQLARPVQTIGIPTTSCLAHQLHQAGHRGLVHIALDAQRREFYLTDFELTDEGTRESGTLRLADHPSIETTLRTGRPVAGPGLQNQFPDAMNLNPDATALCRLASVALEAGAGVDADHLEPIYLREISFVKAVITHPFINKPLNTENP